MNTVRIPASIEEATEQLGAVERLLIARNWERAAIVAAFVRLSDGHAEHPEVRTSTNLHSPNSFAALGIAGLRSDRTVREYVQRWLATHDGVYPEPGADVELPTEEYPASHQASGSTNTRARIVDRAANDADYRRELLNDVRDAQHAAGPSQDIRDEFDRMGGVTNPRPTPAPADRRDADEQAEDDTNRVVLGDESADAMLVVRARGAMARACESLREAGRFVSRMDDEQRQSLSDEATDATDAAANLAAMIAGAPADLSGVES